MYNCTVSNFSEWRQQARYFLYNDIAPETIQWHDGTMQQNSLFESQENYVLSKAHVTANVPAKFIKLARTIACHRNPQKWFLLYSALWRITHQERHLLELSTDPIVQQLLLMKKAVRRDTHKMKAFVRFRLQKFQDQDYYIAWHEPQHRVIELVAPFFQERFSTMLWAIFTPDGYVAWNGEALKISNQIIKIDEINDQVETLWLTYYRSIFNPARIKLKAMRKEMPKCYWPTMPETKLIPSMLQEAPIRMAAMLKASLKN